MATPKNWTMPDSAYDTEANPAYFAIRQSSIEFHSMLKSRAELRRRNDPVLQIKHFDQALHEVTAIVYRRSRSPRDLIIDALGELMLVIGGLFISPIVNELLTWFNQRPRGAFSPDPISILAAIIGVLLIVIKLAINSSQ